jgi:Tetratricopeptide repeat
MINCRLFRIPALSLGVLSCVFINGCRENKPDEILTIQRQLESKNARAESANEAFRYVPQMIQLERRAAVKEISYHLNSWKNTLKPNNDWKKTELLSTLPNDWQKSNWAQSIDLMIFEESECDYLFQCWMMHKVTSWLAKEPFRDIVFAPWLESQKGKIADKDFVRLESAMKFFDWTIRNVWADGNAKDIESLMPNPGLPLSDSGKGYTQLPWQTMMFARGDALARARVFSQLCFQESIPVIWLAIPGGTELKLWAIGVPIGDQIYVFEPRMGLPLPGPNQVGIATLRQAQEDESILRRARLPGFFSYAMTNEQSKQVIGLIDADPMSMSKSMFLLENALTGDTRLKLSIDADAVAAEVKKAAPEMKLRLWALPWMAFDYQKMLRERLKEMTPFTATYMQKQGVFLDDSPVSRARLAHLGGNLDSTVTTDGAFKMYMGLRVDDETLSKLPYDQDIQKALQVKRNANEELDSFMNKVRVYQNIYRASKFFSSSFLAMAQFDAGNYESAANWADKRTLQIEGTEPFRPMCWYLIGRSLEHQGKIAEAVEWYKKSPSAQEPGNRLRARLLNQEESPAG